MKSLGAILLSPLAALAGIYGDLPDATHAWAVHDANWPRPPVVSLDAKGVPSDAVVLFDGTEASYRGNWQAMKGGGVGLKVSGTNDRVRVVRLAGMGVPRGCD